MRLPGRDRARQRLAARFRLNIEMVSAGAITALVGGALPPPPRRGRSRSRRRGRDRWRAAAGWRDSSRRRGSGCAGPPSGDAERRSIFSLVDEDLPVLRLGEVPQADHRGELRDAVLRPPAARNRSRLLCGLAKTMARLRLWKVSGRPACALTPPSMVVGEIGLVRGVARGQRAEILEARRFLRRAHPLRHRGRPCRRGCRRWRARASGRDRCAATAAA